MVPEHEQASTVGLDSANSETEQRSLTASVGTPG